MNEFFNVKKLVVLVGICLLAFSDVAEAGCRNLKLPKDRGDFFGAEMGTVPGINMPPATCWTSVQYRDVVKEVSDHGYGMAVEVEAKGFGWVLQADITNLSKDHPFVNPFETMKRNIAIAIAFKDYRVGFKPPIEYKTIPINSPGWAGISMTIGGFVEAPDDLKPGKWSHRETSNFKLFTVAYATVPKGLAREDKGWLITLVQYDLEEVDSLAEAINSLYGKAFSPSGQVLAFLKAVKLKPQSVNVAQ